MGGGSAQIFRLGSKPGEVLKEQQSIYPQRPVGIWCRMPDVSYPPSLTIFEMSYELYRLPQLTFPIVWPLII